jgi:LPXTG-motif cell wall-anchored protein
VVRAALAVTGSDALQLLAVASTLLVAGAGGLILARRRTTTG